MIVSIVKKKERKVITFSGVAVVLPDSTEVATVGSLSTSTANPFGEPLSAPLGVKKVEKEVAEEESIFCISVEASLRSALEMGDGGYVEGDKVAAWIPLVGPKTTGDMERYFLSGGQEWLGLEGGDKAEGLDEREGTDTERGLCLGAGYKCISGHVLDSALGAAVGDPNEGCVDPSLTPSRAVSCST